MPFGEPLRKTWRRLVDFAEAVLSKGQKKPSLRDLSSVLHLNDHIQDMLAELDIQSDRGAALVAAAMLHVELKIVLRCRLAEFPDSENILFDKEGAPLASLSDCTKVARAIGVIGPVCSSHIDSIRLIRNQFAHSPLKIDFTHPLIAAEVDKLLPDNPDNFRPHQTPQRRRYIGTAVALMGAFENVAKAHEKDTISLWLP